MTTTLQCPECGNDVFEPDADGLYEEGTEATCKECGTKCRVGVDCGDDCNTPGADGTAYAHSDDEVEDVGQPRCDGSCGCVAEFVGKPCLWTCGLTKAWRKSTQKPERTDG